MLLGFYVVALIQLVVVLALAIWVTVETTAVVGIKLGLPLLIAVGATFVGLWRAIRTRSQPPHGLVVTPQDAPELWATVHALAGEVGTRTPDEIRLVPEVNAAVSEDAKLLGLVGGRRMLYLGMPLMQSFTVDQLRAVIAHELGHYSGKHTSLGAVAYRGRLAIGHSISRIGPYNPVGWVFRGYARLYLLVDNAASRRQEREADQASVRVAGPAAAAAALKDSAIADAAWDFFFAQYVVPGWEAGYAPDDLFGGFGQFVAERQDELAELREREPEQQSSRWDTHPSIAERIAIMRTAPQPPHPVDGRPAVALLGAVQAAGLALQREVVDTGNRQVLPWPQFIAAATTAGLQQTSDRIFRSVGRLTGTAEPGLGTLFELVAAGRLGELAEEFFSNATRKEAAAKFAGPMDTLLTLAAIRSGVAFWRMSWSGPVRLIDAVGADLDLEEIAKLAVAPETLDEARARLAELGVRVEAAAVIERQVTARGADVIGAMANVKVDGEHADVLMLDRGLVFVPAPKSTDKGAKRLETLLGSAPVEQLAARHRFVPYEELTGASITKRTPIRADLRLHNGTAVSLEERWAGEQLGKSRDTLLTILDRVARDSE
ncbi:M48 family metallopeptidase [Actinoplanes sp. N902-109]|uniref:M48 family metallopeptidase n=1 Tax=Actinoplanes sp. (strain N902-109) TaxID=649831 RepID=UPI00039E4865|nr:M48 family metallopeptidase [Actinoplanes sp. N902-109]